MNCIQCNKKLKDNAIACSSCGVPVGMKTAYVPNPGSITSHIINWCCFSIIALLIALSICKQIIPFTLTLSNFDSYFSETINNVNSQQDLDNSWFTDSQQASGNSSVTDSQQSSGDSSFTNSQQEENNISPFGEYEYSALGIVGFTVLDATDILGGDFYLSPHYYNGGRFVTSSTSPYTLYFDGGENPTYEEKITAVSTYVDGTVVFGNVCIGSSTSYVLMNFPWFEYVFIEADGAYCMIGEISDSFATYQVQLFYDTGGYITSTIVSFLY